MTDRDRSEEHVGRADHNPEGARQSARDPRSTGSDLPFADDRGGSRDGERLEAGDPGDREQLDNDGGRTPSRR